MGVIHKLKPEVLSFIIENKQNNPALSCRHLTSLILEQLHIKVSKSSINAIFKEKNLSMPIGRRRKQKKKKFNMPVLPVIEDVQASRLGDLPQEIVQDQEKEKLEEEKATQELARIKAQEEARLRELEKVAQEAAENKRKQEEARRLEEERLVQEAAENKRRQEEARKLAEEKVAQEAARIKAKEEARLHELERLAQEAAEDKRKQEEQRKLEEEKAAQELARIKALEEARLRELEKAAQEAAENKRREEEKAAQELARIKAEEEARLHEQERLAQEAAENKRREEEVKKLEEEKIAQELAKIKAQEEARLRELEKAAQELAKIKAQEEGRLRELEKAAQEAARIKALEEARLRDLERLTQEAAENNRLKEEKADQEAEAELLAERERWAKLAEAEQRARQQAEKKEEAVVPKAEPVAAEILPEDRVCSGAIILKALDNFIGGSKEINAAISRAIGGKPEDCLNLTESLIFKSVFGSKDSYSTLGDLIGVHYPQEKLSSYYAQIKQITDIGVDMAKIISNVFTEAKGVKIHFVDDSVIHLDAQLHSSWPGARFPYDFSNIIYELKNNLNKYFLQGAPLVLFSPSGYDILPKDFFSLIVNAGSKDNYPDNLTLFGNQAEELENISLNPPNKFSLIFGLWPWQFTSSRKVKKIGDFSLKYVKEMDRDLYLGEIEIDLFRAAVNQSISLKGCAVKTDIKGKIRLVILNTDTQGMNLEELAGIYLSHWPNFEEAFQDFSRKIELFTFAGADGKFFSKDNFGLDTAGLTMEPAGIFANYIKMLDAYLRWHFLPAEYTDKDLSFTNECFYKIPAKLISGQNRVKVRTLVSQDYQFLKDLEYLNSRLNERQLNSANGKAFWFESVFK